jgi:hypothetical protein
MGVIKKNIHGVLSGKVGNLVYYELMGMNVVRMIGENNVPATRKQLACRMSMRVVMTLIKPAKAFIKRGFMLPARVANVYPHNLAVSYNMEHALVGNYPHIKIDFTKVRVASGGLPVAVAPRVTVVEAGLRFEWQVRPSNDWRDGGHRVMMLAYFPDSLRTVYQLAGETRLKGADLLPLPEELKESTVFCYISFVDLETDETADSQYVAIEVV